MRNISFALTTDQIRAGTKIVTRRMGWLNLAPGTLLQPVRKGMGLKPGEKVERLRGPIRVTSVRCEPLNEIIRLPAYGRQECDYEGFPDYSPASFIDMFCRSHTGCTPDSIVTRIEFEYVAAGLCGLHLWGAPPGQDDLPCPYCLGIKRSAMG